MSDRNEILNLVRTATDERIQLILKIVEADAQSLEAALLACQAERDM